MFKAVTAVFVLVPFQDVPNVLVSNCGPRFFSMPLPGSILLVLDFINAAGTIISAVDYKEVGFRSRGRGVLGAGRKTVLKTEMSVLVCGCGCVCVVYMCMNECVWMVGGKGLGGGGWGEKASRIWLDGCRGILLTLLIPLLIEIPLKQFSLLIEFVCVCVCVCVCTCARLSAYTHVLVCLNTYLFHIPSACLYICMCVVIQTEPSKQPPPPTPPKYVSNFCPPLVVNSPPGQRRCPSWALCCLFPTTSWRSQCCSPAC